jgi:hypothetical protein
MKNISHPLNQEIIDFMRKARLRYEPTEDINSNSNVSVEFFGWNELPLDKLRTHPDLGERLSQISEDLTGVTLGHVLGFDVLVNPDAVILAVAMGTGFMAFRLGVSNGRLALELGGAYVDGLDQQWIMIDPWNAALQENKLLGDLRYWCEQSLAYANEICRSKASGQGGIS